MIDEDMGQVINTQMCSDKCPCYRGANASYYNMYANYGEARFNKYNRTLFDDTDDLNSLKWSDKLFHESD